MIKKLIAAVPLSISITVMGQGTPPKAVISPNIIFILTDDQGWADLSSPMDSTISGSSCSYLRTPNIDLLGKSGVRFTNGYSSAPLCTPSRRSIQFGMTPARQHGTTSFVSDFRPAGHLSIPQALKQVNPAYKCAHFGKWGEVMSGNWHEPVMEANPSALGYDESDGQTGNLTGFDYDSKDPRTETRFEAIPSDDPKLTFSLTNRAIDFMRRQATQGNPFYLQISYYAIHTAYMAKQKTIDKYKNKDLPDRLIEPGTAPMLEDLDTGIGMIMEALKKYGLDENTYIFFTSDNGGDRGLFFTRQNVREARVRNYPLSYYKGQPYEGGIRVPFIVVGPGVNRNSICREPVAGYDLLPTFYDLAGGKRSLPDEIDGGSIVPCLTSKTDSFLIKRKLDGLMFQTLFSFVKASVYREGDYKLMIFWNGPWKIDRVELYNLKTDISENHNLASEMPVKAIEMSNKAIQYLKSVNADVDMNICFKSAK